MARLTVFLIGLLFSPLSSAEDEDYYRLLDVPRNANLTDIKRAYRKLALIHHPDSNPNDPSAQQRFQKLGEAYEVLRDPEKRATYDKYGIKGLKQQEAGQHPHDSFASFFGFGFDFGGGRSSSDAPRGDDIVLDLWATLEELYVGEFVEIKRVKLETKTARGTRKCRCRREMRTTVLGPGQFQMHQVDVCDECPNVSLHRVERHLELEVERGMRDGHLYPFALEGEPHLDGESGDLKFRIRQQKHKYFQRRGDDLYTNITLSLVQSMVGYHIVLLHLDGHEVVLKSDRVTAPGTIIHIPEEGMPNYDNPKNRGALHVTFDVAYPHNRRLTDDERAKIASIFPDLSGASKESLKKPLPAQVYNGLDVLPHATAPKQTT
ncbi:unnamed protein product [Dicrocoelium dendriticum]|nr:unnamed protein product [Dicrocoelium dendriticum]